MNKLRPKEQKKAFYLLCDHRQHHKVDLEGQQAVDGAHFELLRLFEDHHLI